MHQYLISSNKITSQADLNQRVQNTSRGSFNVPSRLQSTKNSVVSNINNNQTYCANTSALSGNSLKSMRRRLSTLMPIMLVDESTNNQNGLSDDLTLNTSSSVAESLYLHDNLASRRISFAFLANSEKSHQSRDRSPSVLSSAMTSLTGLDSQDCKRSAHNFGKGLFVRHRVSNSFRRSSKSVDSERHRMQAVNDENSSTDNAEDSKIYSCAMEKQTYPDNGVESAQEFEETNFFDDISNHFDETGEEVQEERFDPVIPLEFTQLGSVERPVSLRAQQGPPLSEKVGAGRSLTWQNNTTPVNQYSQVTRNISSIRHRSFKSAKNTSFRRQNQSVKDANKVYLEKDCSYRMPWIKTCIEFSNFTNFSCDHVGLGGCASNCYDRQQYQCRELLSAIRRVYASQTERSVATSLENHGEIISMTMAVSKAGLIPSYQSGKLDELDQLSNHTGIGDDSELDLFSLEDSSSLKRKNRQSSRRRTHAWTNQNLPGLESRGVLEQGSINEMNQRFANLVALGINTSSSLGDGSEMEIPSALLQKLIISSNMEGENERKHFFSRTTKRKDSIFTGGSIRQESVTPLFEKFLFRGTSRSNSHGFLAAYDDQSSGIFATSNQSSVAEMAFGNLSQRNSIIFQGVSDSKDNAFVSEDSEISKPMPIRCGQEPKNVPMLRYLSGNVKNFAAIALNMFNKSAILMSEDDLKSVMPLAWELLLEEDPEVVASSASILLFAAVKCPETVKDMLFRELCHINCDTRLNAMLRFRTLWKSRYQVWSRLESSASSYLKLPPTFVEFVLPSPTLGHPGIDVPDPDWQIKRGTSAEEVQLKQNEATKTFVTASTTRKKQQQQLLARAVSAEIGQRKAARQRYHLTNSYILEKAAIEYAFAIRGGEHRDEISGVATDEAGATSGQINNSMQEEFNAAVRRLSVLPINRSTNTVGQMGAPGTGNRSMSWRQGSVSMFRTGTQDLLYEDDELSGAGITNLIPFPTQPLQMTQYVFPSTMCAAVIPLVSLMDDAAVNSEGLSLSVVAEQVIWTCLVEDTSLFLRYIFERLTRVQDKDNLMSVLRKVLLRLPELPMHSAHVIFNNLVGYMMFYIRAPSFSAPESIAITMTVLHLVVPHVQNIYFKDLKQTLRREQIDCNLMLTANLPCAKQFNVFDNDDAMAAQLVRLNDENRDYKFSDIFQEALEGMSDFTQADNCMLLLCDDRSNIIRNLNHYVRDFYTFKRNHTPKLKLRKVKFEDGQKLLQRNAFNIKYQEIGKVLFTSTILKFTPPGQVSNHIFFLHEELSKLPSFPRKALEADISLYDSLGTGKHLYGMDVTHKYTWIQLLRRMFDRMPSTFPWGSDFHIFLNVYNGALILHAEDTATLRHVLASYIHCVHHFRMIFSLNGYLAILPTILRVYNQHQFNAHLLSAIEFTCKQFYVMHRTPFILQMFGAIANYMDLRWNSQNRTSATVTDDRPALQPLKANSFYKIQPEILYKLLRAISKELPDSLGILELCGLSLPLKALDFCYAEDQATWSVLDCVNLCVTVIVYAPESPRARQMITILQALMPSIMRDLPTICAQDSIGGEIKKNELQAIQQLSVAIKQLISTSEWMIRRQEEIRNNVIGAPAGPGERLAQTDLQVTCNTAPVSVVNPLSINAFRRGSERIVFGKFGSAAETQQKTTSNILPRAVETKNFDSNWTLGGPRIKTHEVREAILELICEFLVSTNVHLIELGERQKFNELLDTKSLIRLSEIVQTIIKNLPNDSYALSSDSFQRFFTEVLPLVEWGHESIRSARALEGIINRLNRTLPKLLENQANRKKLNWEKMTNLISAIYNTIQRNPIVSNMKEIKYLVDYLKKTVLMDPATTFMPSTSSATGSYIGIQTGVSGTGMGHFFASATDHSRNGTVIAPTARYVSVGQVGDSSPLHTPVGVAGPRIAGHGRLGNTVLPPSIVIAQPPSKQTKSSFNTQDSSIINRGSANSATCSHQNHQGFENPAPAEFASEIVKLIGLMMQSLGANYQLKDVCERFNADPGVRCPTMLDGGFESLSNYLAHIIIPLLFRCSTGRKDCPVMSKENIFYALDACLTAWFACNPDDCPDRGDIISAVGINPNTGTSGAVSTKAISLAQATTTGSISLTTPLGAHHYSQVLTQPIEIIGPTSFLCEKSGRLKGTLACLVDYKHQQEDRNLRSPQAVSSSNLKIQPTKNLRMETESTFRAEFAQRLGYLGVKLILIAYPRHALARSRRIIATLTKMSHYQHGGLHLWKFVDFLVTYRPPIFPYLLASIHLKMAQIKCETQGEQAFQQIVNQKLIGLHMPPSKSTVNVLRSLINDLRSIRQDFIYSKRQISERVTQSKHHLDIAQSGKWNSLDPLQPIGASSGSVQQPPTSCKRTLGGRKSIGLKAKSTNTNVVQKSNLNVGNKIIPSLASDSATSSMNEAQQGPEAIFGMPTNTSSQANPQRKSSFADSNSRRSLLRQRSNKRIKASDGSRIICRHQSLSNRQPILTASVESLPRKSLNYAQNELVPESKLRRTGTTVSAHAASEIKVTPRLIPMETAVPSFPVMESLVLSTELQEEHTTALDEVLLTNAGAGQNASELVATSGNFAKAAHVAQSLFGSAAPYNRAKESAKDQLSTMMGDFLEATENQDVDTNLSGHEMAQILEAKYKREMTERQSKEGTSASSVCPIVRYV